MIGKKIINPDKSALKITRILNLAEYIANPTSSNELEKCVHYGARNFISDDKKSHAMEMAALANACVKAKDPIVHYVLSWQDGEIPTNEQADDAVDLFCKVMGVEAHQVIYGLHADTENLHLHILLNKVNPETEKVYKIGNGFDIEKLHQAVAAIEYKQGWRKEKNARYSFYIDEDSGDLKVSRNSKKLLEDEVNKNFGGRISDEENRTGVKSAIRYAAENAWPLILESSSWEEVHSNLALLGMRYEKKGSGAVLFVNNVAIKPSDIAKNASFANMEKRFGKFISRASDVLVVGGEYETFNEPITLDVPGVEEFIKKNRERKLSSKALRDELFAKQKADFKRLLDLHKIARNQLNSSNSWKGKGSALNEARKELALRQKAEIDAIKEVHRVQRLELKNAKKKQMSCTEYLEENFGADVAYDYTHRNSNHGLIKGASSSTTVLTTIFYAVSLSLRVVTKEYGGCLYYKLSERENETGADFIDRGDKISVLGKSIECVKAALAIAVDKFGNSLEVESDDDLFLSQVAQLSVEFGLHITKPDHLVEKIEILRNSSSVRSVEAPTSENTYGF